MRDPRESHMWGAVASVPEPEPEDDELFYELSRQINAVKNTIKVLSLTRDDREPRSHDVEIFGRGFAHPRLWEHYADNHRGVCLCLEKETFVRMLCRDLVAQGDLKYGDVEYEDGPIAREALHFDLPTVRSGGVKVAIDEHLAAHHQELFFRKARDWQSEMEYRVVLTTDHPRPVYVNIGQSLKNVVLGVGVPWVYVSALNDLCGPSQIELFQVRWMNGRPDLLPPPMGRIRD